MQKYLLAILLALYFPSVVAADENQTGQASPGGEETILSGVDEESELQQYLDWAKSFWYSLTPRKGKIDLGGVATLDVPGSFYFLDQQDSERVLTEAWGNPSSDGTLGMLFPDAMTPFDADTWAVTIEYKEAGYISDDDAEEIDSDGLMLKMQREAVEETRNRLQQGYESIEIRGWVEKPVYDRETHKLHWAKEIKFGSQESGTLNYNIRVLGRKGVLVFNFVSDMQQKEEVAGSIETVLAMSTFNQGYRYEEFDPATDKVAGYGVSALIAGQAVATSDPESTLLSLLKKYWLLLLMVPAAFALTVFRRRERPAS